MSHYYVFHENKKFFRVIDAQSSFEARSVLSRATKSPVTEFYAVRKDLLKDVDHALITKISETEAGR